MGLLDRMRRLTIARIESFLTTAEDPEIIFPQLVREMEDQVRAATEAEAKAMASVKSIQREIDQLKAKVDRLQKGAQLAMDKADEVTARDAVTAQIAVEGDLKRKEDALPRTQAAYSDAREGRKQLQAQLEELRAKKDEILTRARVSKTQKKVQKTVQGPAGSSRSILDAVSQMESKIDETEAELEVQKELSGQGGGASLEKRLADLEKSSSVEDRLEALKQKAGKAK